MGATLEQPTLSERIKSSVNVTKMFTKYEYLSTEYAYRVKNYSRFGLEFSDIEQEMKIKIYMSIVGFAKQWKEFRETGFRKPAPLEYWLRATLSNKVKDFIKRFNTNSISNEDKMSVERDKFDVGVWSTMDSEFDEKNLQCVLNGVSLVKDEWDEEQKRVYMMFLKGYKPVEIKKQLKVDFNVKDFIDEHNLWLRENKREQLLDFSEQRLHQYDLSKD